MRVSVRLATLAATLVAVSMVVCAVAFNLFMGRHVSERAIEAVEAAADIGGREGEDHEDEGREGQRALGRGGRGARAWRDDAALEAVSYLELDGSFQPMAHGRRKVSDEELQLADWFSSHRARGEVVRVQVGRWTCMAALVDDVDPETPDAAATQGGYLIAYVDITNEGDFIWTLNVAFVALGLVLTVAAALVGHAVGRGIERTQEAQRRFYENMSHELKTPVAAIRGFADGARSGVMETTQALDGIVAETERMSGVVAEILDLSRVESGAVTVRTEPLEVGDFVQDCLMPFEGMVRTRGIDVELDLADGEVEADPFLFGHALTNVLSNAMRHASKRVYVTYAGDELVVGNDGRVPDERELPHLFERFHVGEGGSTGIGLAMTMEVATLHGWDVFARRCGACLEVVFVFHHGTHKRRPGSRELSRR